MILVDTSVWIDHLRNGNDRLRRLLLDGSVYSHPFVVGELACGNLKDGEDFLGFLQALPQARQVDHDEALHLVARRGLQGRGLGWIEVHLLASALIDRCSLWTLDGPLKRVAATLDLEAWK